MTEKYGDQPMQNAETLPHELRYEKEGWTCIARFRAHDQEPHWDFALVAQSGRVVTEWVPGLILSGASSDEPNSQDIEGAKLFMEGVVEQAIWDPLSTS